jgi:Cu/Ag efflux pump CusA
MTKNAGWIALGLGLVVAMLYFLFRRPTTSTLLTTGIPTNPGGSFIGQIVGGISRDLSNVFGSSSTFSTSVSQPGIVAGSAAYNASRNAGPSTSAAVYQPGDSFQDYAEGLFGPGTDTGVV